MVQKYQNEIAPIFYYRKKLKTSGKLLKIPDLQASDWGQPYWMTLYTQYGEKGNEIFIPDKSEQTLSPVPFLKKCKSTAIPECTACNPTRNQYGWCMPCKQNNQQYPNCTVLYQL